MYRPSLQAAAWAAALLIGGSPIADSATAGTEVVASIKPVHSLVAGVMAGIGEPHLIVRGGGSPHGFAMRPSDARALASAGLVFWIGPDMEGFLDGPARQAGRRCDDRGPRRGAGADPPGGARQRRLGGASP